MLKSESAKSSRKEGETMARDLYQKCGDKQDMFLKIAGFCLQELAYLQEGVRTNFNTVEKRLPAMVTLLERNDFKVNLIQTLMFMRENDVLVQKLVPKIVKDLHKLEFHLENGKSNLHCIANRMCGIFPNDDEEEEEEEQGKKKPVVEAATITETLSGPEEAAATPTELDPPKPKKRKRNPRTQTPTSKVEGKPSQDAAPVADAGGVEYITPKVERLDDPFYHPDGDLELLKQDPNFSMEDYHITRGGMILHKYKKKC